MISEPNCLYGELCGGVCAGCKAVDSATNFDQDGEYALELYRMASLLGYSLEDMASEISFHHNAFDPKLVDYCDRFLSDKSN